MKQPVYWKVRLVFVVVQICRNAWFFREVARFSGELKSLREGNAEKNNTVQPYLHQVNTLQRMARWWFQTFFMFSGEMIQFDYILIFFKWVETTNWMANVFHLPRKPFREKKQLKNNFWLDKMVVSNDSMVISWVN